MQSEIEQLFDIPKVDAIFPLSGGGNNRVFKIEFKNHEPLIYKQYFQHPNDSRPRLGTEFSFLQYAWGLGLRNVPKPLQINPSANAALYSFLPGRFVQRTDIDDSLIQQTIDFFLTLNQTKESGVHLSNASEAIFSIGDALRVVEDRIARLKSIPLDNAIAKEAADFFQHELLPKWKSVQEWICKTALHEHSPISMEERCISPSDFGFHNALIAPQGELSFIDFEYAGWDDPGKTICDLFCQPKIPIPQSYFTRIAEAFASITSHPEACLKRIEMIRPVVQIKWCCILLNTFTQVGKSRRIFSKSGEVDKQEMQLHAAKELLNQVIRVWHI